jgi:hypothetical protein
MSNTQIDAMIADSDRWRRDNLPSDSMMAIARDVQAFAAKLLEYGLTLKSIDLDRLPQYYEAKPNPPDSHTLEVQTIAGAVRVAEPSPEGMLR